MRKLYLPLALVILFAPGCPFLVANKLKEQHDHCARRVLCLYEDGQCCADCGGRCP
jgi:hypothetical protein